MMLKAGVEANTISYTAGISACANAHNIANAEYWFFAMSEAGIQPSHITHNIMARVRGTVKAKGKGKGKRKVERKGKRAGEGEGGGGDGLGDTNEGAMLMDL